MTEDAKRRTELAMEFEKERRQELGRIYAVLNEEQKAFLDHINDLNAPGSFRKITSSTLADDLQKHLADGKKPSKFFDTKGDWLFHSYVLPRHREMLLYTVDHITRWQYAENMWRRSFRSADYLPYCKRMLLIVCSLCGRTRIDADIADILTLNLPEKEKAYIEKCDSSAINPAMIAYALDQNDPRVIEALKDILNGEGAIPISYSIFRGIVMSSNAKMHDYLGKLLLAARLQEGLRQTICECADTGTIEAFLSLLTVIEENNLIRFSSVKRAVGTWTGLMASDSSDLERISGKTVRLIKECLSDEKAREGYLSSEDSMEICLALWAYGTYEIRDAVAKFAELSENGSHHQILTAGYFASNIDEPAYAQKTAKQIILKHDEPDILAVYLPYMIRKLKNLETALEDAANRDVMLNLNYADRDEAEQFYARLQELYDHTPKKAQVFSPCIFPWYSVTFDRSALMEKMYLTAIMLHDNAKLDDCVSRIKDQNSDTRRWMIHYSLKHPETDVQRAALVECLGDKDYSNRMAAAKYLKEITLTPENYLQLEAMLRFKAADLRKTLISLLYMQEDDALYGTTERLCADKLEEKRTAGLDLIIQLSADEERTALFEKCRPLAARITNPSSKEKILIESITGAKEENDLPALYDENDACQPYIPDNDYTVACVKKFMEYFPDSEIGSLLYPKEFKKPLLAKLTGAVKNECASYQQAIADLESLHALIEEHRKDEFVSGHDGTTCTLDCDAYHFSEKHKDKTTGRESYEIPFLKLWMDWYAEKIASPVRLHRMNLVLRAYDKPDEFSEAVEKYIDILYGKGFTKPFRSEYRDIIHRIADHLRKVPEGKLPGHDGSMLSAAAELWFLKCVPEEDVMLQRKSHWNNRMEYVHLISHAQLWTTFHSSYYRDSERRMDLFALDLSVWTRCTGNEHNAGSNYLNGVPSSISQFQAPRAEEYFYLAYVGELPERTLYHYIFERKNCFGLISKAAVYLREEVQGISRRRRSYYGYRSQLDFHQLFGHWVDKEHPLTEEDKKFLTYIDGFYDVVIPRILDVELKRGDTETPYSDSITNIMRIYGMENLIAILSALGKDTLERSMWNGTKTKKGSLSHLLSVCVPADGDDAVKLKELVKGTDITDKRLIEAAMYSPKWMDIIGEYLGWNGFTSACYYFMAHMNESFDDRREAIIAKYTPLTPEELNAGAFDVDWFKSAYETLGEKPFNMIYDAAKYISDGAKHSRARKYADAALGKYEPEKTKAEIAEKRNKDLLMAYALIPFDPARSEDDLCERYLYLQQFLKESKKFGSQRSASEKSAVETAMQNLATNAHYADVMRLTLRMETKIIDDSRELFEEKEIEDVTVKLVVDELGKTAIVCTKAGKALKSIPAKLKKNVYIVQLTETKKKLTEQYRRTRQMFEQAMESSDEYTVSEILTIMENPVAKPILCNLVFRCGKKLGFLNGNSLVDYSGKKSKVQPEDKLIVAHPFALYTDGHWADYQRYLFDNQLIQPFKQVFRELYVKTPEEAEMTHSLRYAGNQIQPGKTLACLKTRRWIADIYGGLQKVYYKENIVARIYALADWFSPADIEAPTLEWVEFSDRKTGKELTIREIPDIIFSEVMRDVDLAVSVAHAGGVDPETSHSTIEMRAALLEFTLPLFKLTNITIEGTHAHIHGALADYTLHLGSGVVHKKGGAMIPILPVHSQHRGKLFLPFADDDPKTAEILSKALLLAEDKKIKDPMILEAIRM